jgi:hypothetical protein
MATATNQTAAAAEEPIVLVGASGREHRCARFSPRALRGLDAWLRQRRLRDLYESIGEEMPAADRAITIAEVLRNDIMDYECALAWDNMAEAQVHVLHRLLKTYQPQMREGDVRAEFGDRLDEVKAAVDAASGIPTAVQLKEAAEKAARDGDGGEDEDAPPDPRSSGDESTPASVS